MEFVWVLTVALIIFAFCLGNNSPTNKVKNRNFRYYNYGGRYRRSFKRRF